MKRNYDGIEVSETFGNNDPIVRHVTINDDLMIASNSKQSTIQMNRGHGEITHFETLQLAAALLAMETLIDTDDYEAMDTITTMLETMNNVREKLGHEPLVQVNYFYDDEEGRERVGYTVTKA